MHFFFLQMKFFADTKPTSSTSQQADTNCIEPATIIQQIVDIPDNDVSADKDSTLANENDNEGLDASATCCSNVELNNAANINIRNGAVLSTANMSSINEAITSSNANNAINESIASNSSLNNLNNNTINNNNNNANNSQSQTVVQQGANTRVWHPGHQSNSAITVPQELSLEPHRNSQAS